MNNSDLIVNFQLIHPANILRASRVALIFHLMAKNVRLLIDRYHMSHGCSQNWLAEKYLGLYSLDGATCPF